MMELSAIAMDFKTSEIIDVFHEHAYAKQENDFATLHVHGLVNDYVRKKGHENTAQLIDAFRSWLKGKIVLTIYGNNPAYECRALDMNILDVDLDKWIDRIHRPYHIIANAFKNKFLPISGKRCTGEAHRAFLGVRIRGGNESDIARHKHGVHCSLYDCYEMYLCYITTM